jgi:hypothetical protein
MKKSAIKVVVACVNAEGASDLVPVIVSCTEKERKENAHIELAYAVCEEEGYEQPMIGFDYTDAHRGVFGLFDWQGEDVVIAEIGGEA